MDTTNLRWHQRQFQNTSYAKSVNSSTTEEKFTRWTDVYIYPTCFTEVFRINFFSFSKFSFHFDLIKHGIYLFIPIYNIGSATATVYPPPFCYQYFHIPINASIFPRYTVHVVIDTTPDLFKAHYWYRL